MQTNMTEIDFRQAGLIPVMLACLPAGYTLVSGSSSRRGFSRKTISGRVCESGQSNADAMAGHVGRPGQRNAAGSGHEKSKESFSRRQRQVSL